GFRGEEVFGGRLCHWFLLPGQGGSFGMNLGVFYWKLSASANGEVACTAERLFRIVQQVIDRLALTVVKIIVMGCVQFGHSVFQSDCMCRLPKGSTAGRYPSNRAIQSGYILILRWPWWIAITRVAT